MIPSAAPSKATTVRGQRSSQTPGVSSVTGGKPKDKDNPDHDHAHEVHLARAKSLPDPDPKYPHHWEEDREHEDGGDDKESLGEKLFRTENVLRIFLHVIGRFPMSIRGVTKGHAEVEFTWKQPQGVYFIVTSVIIVFLLVIGVINMCLMGYGVLDESWDDLFTPRVAKIVRTRETACFHRGFLLLIITGMNVLNATVATYVMIKKRHLIANYFEFWTSSIENSRLDASRGVNVASIKSIVITSLLAFWVVPGSAIKLAAMINGSVVFGVVTFRLFSPLMLLPNENNEFNYQFYVITTLAVILMMFTFLWARSLVIVYFIKVKELINAIGYWNGRVYGAVLRNDNPQTKEARTTYSLLFKDHCAILDLIDSTNSIFEGVLESYFATHAFSFIFQLFFFFVVMHSGHRLDLAAKEFTNDLNEQVPHGKFFIRRYDVISVVVIFLLDQTFYFMVLLSSGEVSQEVMGGLEIARRTSLIGRKTDEELFFILSLFNSFNRFSPIEMEGGGYFKINKELFVTFTVILVLCLVIGLMFRPIYDWSEDRDIVGPFISALEGLPQCHWQVSFDNWTTCDV